MLFLDLQADSLNIISFGKLLFKHYQAKQVQLSDNYKKQAGKRKKTDYPADDSLDAFELIAPAKFFPPARHLDLTLSRHLVLWLFTKTTGLKVDLCCQRQG